MSEIATFPEHRLLSTPGERRPRVLVFAFACDPYRGSEPGAGWNIVRALASHADCTVLVGSEHTPNIRRWEATHDCPHLTFVEVPEPHWFSPPAGRHRLTWVLLYLAWRSRALAIAKELHLRTPFDATWHATYSAYWLPAPAVDLGLPCVWGPVGGAVTTPLRLWPLLGWRGILDEAFDWLAVRALSQWPATRRTWAKADVHLVQNEATLDRLPAHLHDRARLFNHALLTRIPGQPSTEVERHCLFVGALEARKGARLAIHAVAHMPPDISLTVVGDGPERKALEHLAERMNIAHRVRFLGRVPREEVLHLVSTASVMLFTGLREEGGIALAEAMLSGVPSVVLEVGGAKTVAEAATDPRRVVLVRPEDVSGTARRLGEAIAECCELSPSDEPSFDQAAAELAIREALAQALGRRLPSSNPARATTDQRQ